MTAKLPLLITVTGPSGTGKDAVIKMLCKKDPTITRFITATTRKPRPGEEDGVHYYFWSYTTFETAIENGEMAEHDFHYDNLYGTPKFELQRHFSMGHHAVSDINYDGVKNIRKSYPDQHFSILIVPPSKERLLSRLTQRNPELAHEGMARFKSVEVDLDHLNDEGYTFINQDMRGSKRSDYDAIFVNDDLEVTTFSLYKCIKDEIIRRQKLVPKEANKTKK